MFDRLTEPRVGSILGVGAHPDDLLLGAGGFLALLAQAGHRITMLTLSAGSLAGNSEVREMEERSAASVCGFDLVYCGLQDGGLTLPQCVSSIEQTIGRVAPDLVLTHHPRDSHQDHVVAHQATLAAARRVRSLYTYEGPSSQGFEPTLIVDCTPSWPRKIEALDCYPSQMERRAYGAWADAASRMRAWPHHVGSRCEAFSAVRHDFASFPSVSAQPGFRSASWPAEMSERADAVRSPDLAAS